MSARRYACPIESILKHLTPESSPPKKLLRITHSVAKNTFDETTSLNGEKTCSSNVPTSRLFGKHRLKENVEQVYSLATSFDITDIEDEDTVDSKLRLQSGKRSRAPNKTTREEGDEEDVQKVLLKKNLYLTPESVCTALVPCCKKKCNEDFTYSQVLLEREAFWNKDRNKQADWLKRMLALWGHLEAENSVFNFKYFIHEKPCCAAFFENALPVSHGRLCTARQRVLNNELEDACREPSPQNQKKCDRVEQFLRSYLESFGEGMPNQMKAELPEGHTKEEVYIAYLCSFKTADEQTSDACSLSYWYKSWKARLPDLTCSKWKKFSKCTVCSNLKAFKAMNNEAETAGKYRDSCQHDLPKCPDS